MLSFGILTLPGERVIPAYLRSTISMAAVLVYLAVPIIILLLAVARRSSSRNKSGRSLPPSPPSCLPIIGHLHLLTKYKEPLHRSLTRISSLYRAPVLLLHFGSRPVLVVSSPEAAEECLTTNDTIFANRPRIAAAKYLGSNSTSLSFAPYGPHWRNLRRLTTVELFSTNRLNESSAVRSEEARFLVARLTKRLKEETGDESPMPFRKVTLKPLLFDMVYNHLMRMLVGKKYAGEGTEGTEQVRRLHSIVEEGFRLAGASNLADFIPVLRWIGIGGLDKQLKALKTIRDEFFQQLIDECKVHKTKQSDGRVSDKLPDQRTGGSRMTTLDVLLSLQQEDPEYYTDDMIRIFIMTLFFAGTDTSALTTEWAMTLLLNHQDKLSIAQAEVDSVVGLKRLVNESDLSQLPYLQAVISETLRLYPVAPLLVPHESWEDCVVSGFHVPRGTMLIINAWAIQRSDEVWDEPTEFKPERFLQKGGDGGTTNYKMIPFGSGRRRCPGEGLGIRIVGLALAALIQCFDWERTGFQDVDMEQGKGLTMPKDDPLEAMCRPRNVMEKYLTSEVI